MGIAAYCNFDIRSRRNTLHRQQSKSWMSSFVARSVINEGFAVPNCVASYCQLIVCHWRFWYVLAASWSKLSSAARKPHSNTIRLLALAVPS
jgi:hypothetical protein